MIDNNNYYGTSFLNWQKQKTIKIWALKEDPLFLLANAYFLNWQNEKKNIYTVSFERNPLFVLANVASSILYWLHD